MALKAEDFSDQGRFRHLLTIPYEGIVDFVLDYIRRKSFVTLFFWSLCLICAGYAIWIRLHISGVFEFKRIFSHSLLGTIVFPILIIPVHELLHLIPFFLSGARKIKIGMDLKQYIFYVTAHRHVATPIQFRLVAITPFIVISLISVFLIFLLPGLWKWSISIFLFVHTTMCAGDFAMLNYFHINRKKKIYTWDDADLREAYFYEEIQ
jgi:hypothetical protein